ncbi:MAG: erythromycin esterase family protein [Opitutales bacterium]|nr:erythromycin esterase family protein [Opitutales bacterium]
MAAGFVPVTESVSPDLPLPWLAELGEQLDDKAALEALAERMRDRRLVLLGESTHGTHEYYTWRDRISRRLIETGDYRFIAVEGDWASLLELNRYVKNKPGAPETARAALEGLERWPTWMWANEEVEALAEWLREWNQDRPMEERAGFYGKDVYAPWAAADAVIAFARDYLSSDERLRVRRKLARFQRNEEDIQAYVRSTYPQRAETLENFRALVSLVAGAEDAPAFEKFTAKQSAYVVKGAHLHFTGMVDRGPESWNARVGHMESTVERLLERYGQEARGIVWAHNTHIGDARATAMAERGEVNIGQLARERHGIESVFALGFTTHRGRVQAGRQWGGRRQSMRIPDGIAGSLEDALNIHFPEGALLFFDDAPETAHTDPVPHRAIGVVYRPEAEQGNYVPTRLAARYNAMLFLPETHALRAFE